LINASALLSVLPDRRILRHGGKKKTNHGITLCQKDRYFMHSLNMKRSRIIPRANEILGSEGVGNRQLLRIFTA
jgi:hypothetical protein